MVSIYVNGEDKTGQISDWTISCSDKHQVLQLTCHFPSKKTFTRPLSECQVVPTHELAETLLTKRGSTIVQPIQKATIYGDRYAAVYFPENTTPPYIYKLGDIDFLKPTQMKESSVFRYLVDVANARKNRAGTENQQSIAANVIRQLDKLPASSNTALYAYCTGSNSKRIPGQGLIFPFGLNESQLAAVERAFSAQISVIEGPPGTGKTQTILNILANILLRGKTVAVLSNNNAAVANVYDKLKKNSLDHLVAKLGNKDNQKDFFANLPPYPPAAPSPTPNMAEIQTILGRVKQLLRDHNAAAQLRAEIDELTIERSYLRQWQENYGVPLSASLDKYGLSPRKTADLMAYLSYLGERRIRLKDRLELLFNFKIFRTKPFAQNDERLSFFYALQMHFYDKALKDKETALNACLESLARGNFDALLGELTTKSMCYLKHHLHAKRQISETFDAKTYKKHFDKFVHRFPILGSSTHSIVNSIAPGSVLDYVIIDEASQQDIIPGILALGCAQNLIVVGDSRQLAHIPETLGIQPPTDVYDCERYSLLDSCIGVFKDNLPKTLLKEHYRCHPKIIQFCNQQFYDNALVPMTQDKGEAPLRVLITAKGNHARKNLNQRELESLQKALDDEGESIEFNEDGRGFISPFRAQATLAGSYLPSDFVKDTVHKFQGRECDEIVFSTVLDKKGHNQKRLGFVDDPRMVNVAVSRAKNRFTLVTGDEVFTANNGHIAALIRYVEYYAQDGQIVHSPVVSAFDLLYQEYDESLARLEAKLRTEDSRFKSEQIVAQLLRDALSKTSYSALTFHTQIRLSQIASASNPALTKDELNFMQNRASCDFVLYFKVGKTPLGVIEVDGGSHDRPEQVARDTLKNSILAKSDIPILRLRTVESSIEEKIDRFLMQWVPSIIGW